MNNLQKSNATSCSQDQDTYKLSSQQLFQQIKIETMKQWYVWKHVEPIKYPEMQEKKADYLTECYEIFLRAIMFNSNNSININHLFEKTRPKINTIDNVIIDYVLFRTDDGASIYNWLWVSMVNEIWSQFLSGNHKIIKSVKQSQTQNISKYLSDFMQEFEQQKEQQQPIFSQDSQNQQQTQIQPRKKYSSYSLHELIGTQQIELLKQNLNILSTKQKNSLISNINSVFHLQKSNPNPNLYQNSQKLLL